MCYAKRGSWAKNVNFQKLQKKKNNTRKQNTKMLFFRTNINLNHCATLWKLSEPIGERLDGDTQV